MHIELVFRFNPVEYEVEENDGFVGVDITFTYGIPGDYQPSITLSINNGTATGQVHIRSAALPVILTTVCLLLSTNYRRNRLCNARVVTSYFYRWQ